MRSSSIVRIGVIGCGHWGPNHIRVFSAMKGCQVVAACDQQESRRLPISESYPHIRLTDDWMGITSDPNIDVVVIATPTNTHYEIAKAALVSGKDILCEKPLAILPEECDELVERSERARRIFMVGHIYLFNTGIQQIFEYVNRGDLGPVRYAYSVRSNQGPIRYDVSAVYDLASHDVSVFNFLFGSVPEQVDARGMVLTEGGHHDIAFVTLYYPGDVLVNVHVSWLAVRKTRQMIIVGQKRTAEWDELSDVGPVRLLDPTWEKEPEYRDFGEFQLVSREADIKIPRIPPVEPMQRQAIHFIESVRTRETPLCDVRRGADIVRTLWLAEQSMLQNRR